MENQGYGIHKVAEMGYDLNSQQIYQLETMHMYNVSMTYKMSFWINKLIRHMIPTLRNQESTTQLFHLAC